MILHFPIAIVRLQLEVEDIQEGEPLIFALMVENQMMRPGNWHFKEKLSTLSEWMLDAF